MFACCVTGIQVAFWVEISERSVRDLDGSSHAATRCYMPARPSTTRKRPCDQAKLGSPEIAEGCSSRLGWAYFQAYSLIFNQLRRSGCCGSRILFHMCSVSQAGIYFFFIWYGRPPAFYVAAVMQNDVVTNNSLAWLSCIHWGCSWLKSVVV